MIIKYQVKRKKYESQLKKTISFAAAAVMLSAGSQSAFAEEAVFPESLQEQTASGEEYEPAEPAEPIDDLIIDDSSAENSSTAESDDSYDSYDSAEESIADEHQAQKSECRQRSDAQHRKDEQDHDKDSMEHAGVLFVHRRKAAERRQLRVASDCAEQAEPGQADIYRQKSEIW
jgi:hypothetical protein